MAKGKRVRRIGKQSEPGRWSVTEVVGKKLENIPSDDWTDASLFRIGNDFHVEGCEILVSSDTRYVPKAWV